MRLAVVQVRDVPAEVAARVAHCLATLQACAEADADLDSSAINDVRGGDGGGHTYLADRRPELHTEISPPAE